MKTTLLIPDQLFRELKRRAAERRTTLSALVEETLRRGLEEETDTQLPGVLEPLPVHHLGAPLVDLADRDALWRVMESEHERKER